MTIDTTTESPSNFNFIERIIRQPERRAITGLSDVQWWREEKAGRAPKRIRLSRHAVGWPLSALQRWVSARIGDTSIQAPTLPRSPGRNGKRKRKSRDGG